MCNLFTSLFIYLENEDTGSQQLGPAIITTLTGGVQILALLVLFCMSMTPSPPHTEERLWIIKARAMLFFALNFLGLLALPLFAFAWALNYRDSTEISYLWNVVCFFNTIFLAAVTIKANFRKMLKHLLKPTYPLVDNNKGHPSFVIKECPTRNLYLREDIYCFCWTLCKQKTELRRLGFNEQ